MGGINISQKHNLINKSKSPLFYTLISVIILTILTIIAISIKLSFSNAAGDTEGVNDTAIATLNNVDILQAGTGQSVTIKGETLNENDYGPDNATRRTILNNNIVRYNANYNVTKVGQITFSITLPANNTIDEATIAESQGCLPNLSKLESADITNSDGTITKSYTNNKAICVRNITTTGSTNWQITAYLWGANNTKIQPTLAVSGETSTVRPEEISVVGRGDYRLVLASVAQQGADNGYDTTPLLMTALYGVRSEETGVLGLAPIDEGNWEFEIDMSSMPKGWKVYSVSDYGFVMLPSGSGETSVVYSGKAGAYKKDDNTMVITHTGSVTAALHCPERRGDTSNTFPYEECYYSVANVKIASPLSSLTDAPKTYSMSVEPFAVSTGGSSMVEVIGADRLIWELSSRSRGEPSIYPYLYYERIVGWTGSYVGQPVYTGEYIYKLQSRVDNIFYSGDTATNVNYCNTWNPSVARTDSSYSPINSSSIVQYGIIGTDMSVLPSSSQQYCGKVGDENIPGQHMFFDTLEEANAYAKQNNLAVNAIRVYTPSVSFSGDNYFLIGEWDMKIFGSENKQVMYANASTTLDQWVYRNATSNDLTDTPKSVISPIIVPGLLSHTLTAIPSSTNPGKEDHITITTKTYNKDTDSKITVNLPEGLTPKEGSFTITTGYEYNDGTNTNEPIKAVLVEGEGQDYTITSGDGSTSSDSSSSTPSGSSSSSTSSNSSGTIVTFNLDHIASTHHVPITGYDPIYPGESGVTNITLNSDTGLYEEVITTNNNNEDSNLLNDDLPIAADNDGNGISHIGTPIEFDVTINEDTPSPSTLTINSTASGTGTDYASTTFKTASDTIAVANPPAMFGYDLTASSNNIYAGDNLTYDYSISNTTDTNATNIQMITVLPFNGDSRGTTGLMDMTKQDGSSTTSNPFTITNPYTISNLSLSLPSDGAGGLDTSATKLYYTLDPKAHELESNPETLALDSSITWQELELDSDGNIPTDIMTNLQQQGVLDSITALKLTTTTLPSSSQLRLNVTLDNILATTPSTKATLANDITYLSYTLPNANTISNTTSTNTNIRTILRQEDDITTYSDGQVTSIHQNPNTVNYLGELLALSIPEGEQTIQVGLDLNDVVIGNPSISDDSTNPVNHLSLTTATLRGYTLTAQASTENGALLTEQEDTRSIPAISTEPTKGTAGWSAKIAGSNNQSLAGTTWTATPGINQTPLNLYASAAKGRDSRNLTVTYGFSAANTIADTYSAKVVYTVVGEP